jgi:hypothetical protein
LLAGITGVTKVFEIVFYMGPFLTVKKYWKGKYICILELTDEQAGWR